MDGYLFCLVNLVDDPSVEKGQEEERDEGREYHPCPIDVVILVIWIEPQLSRRDVSLTVGPGNKEDEEITRRKNLVIAKTRK